MRDETILHTVPQPRESLWSPFFYYSSSSFVSREKSRFPLCTIPTVSLYEKYGCSTKRVHEMKLQNIEDMCLSWSCLANNRVREIAGLVKNCDHKRGGHVPTNLP